MKHMSTSTLVKTPHLENTLAPTPASSGRSLTSKITHEPLVHFLLVGSLILTASTIVSKHRNNADRRIVIDKSLVMHFVTLYEAQMGALPSQSQVNGMIDDYIRQEVQFREAKRMGLDKDDEIVRRRLASKFDFLERDLVAVPDPSTEDLERYYYNHQKDFLQPPRVSFTHIYFSPDHGGDPAARFRAEETLIKLQSKRVTRAPDLGDRFALQTDYSDFERLDLVQQFGDSPIVERVFRSTIRQWNGPVRSGYGWHLIYVAHREEASLPPLDEVRDKVKAAYIDRMKEKTNREKYDALQKGYIIERAYLR